VIAIETCKSERSSTKLTMGEEAVAVCQSVSQSGNDGRGKERTLSVKFIAALESPPWSKSFNPSMSPIFAEARGQRDKEEKGRERGRGLTNPSGEDSSHKKLERQTTEIDNREKQRDRVRRREF
jgi:hypothetical protein